MGIKTSSWRRAAPAVQRMAAEASGGPRLSVLLFLVTLVSVYATYGFQWAGGNPFTEPHIALPAAAFSGGLMATLLAHEMGHYLVARRHGFRLTLPYFLPFPAGFGTLGAIIRLKSPPRSREHLLEMGAAGPLAGAAVAFLLLAVGLRWTGPPIELEPGATYLIFGDPLALKILGTLILGAPPDRYAELHPLAMAGWVGCLLTAINLLPVGQLDGGHIMGALQPARARLVSKVVIGMLLVAGILWPGWAVWAALLLALRAWRNLPVPAWAPLDARARWVALAALGVFLLTFMPRPIELETTPPEANQER